MDAFHLFWESMSFVNGPRDIYSHANSWFDNPVAFHECGHNIQQNQTDIRFSLALHIVLVSVKQCKMPVCRFWLSFDCEIRTWVGERYKIDRSFSDSPALMDYNLQSF